jgi:hypothetical protein
LTNTCPIVVIKRAISASLKLLLVSAMLGNERVVILSGIRKDSGGHVIEMIDQGLLVVEVIGKQCVFDSIALNIWRLGVMGAISVNVFVYQVILN